VKETFHKEKETFNSAYRNFFHFTLWPAPIHVTGRLAKAFGTGTFVASDKANRFTQ